MVTALRESDDGEVRGCLEAALATTGEARRVVDLRREPFAYETSFAIDRLAVRLEDGAELRLLAKDVGRAGLSAEAAAAKPRHTLDPRREIAVYRSLLGPAALATPRFHGAAEDDGRAWLFVEEVPGTVLTDLGGPAAWGAAAAFAAGLDAAIRPHRDPALEPLLLHRDRAWHRHWLDAAVAEIGEGELSERLRAGGDALLDRLDALPRAFVHGELYPANAVVRMRDDAPVRVAAVDWELAGTGPFALDLAALASGWRDEGRLAICESFRLALPTPISRPDLLAAVDLCELSLSLQWIGWSPTWTPPPEHRRDWPAEALRLLDAVGL
ncbi:MAG: phosphotransferase [Actinobacteria bacterium]|nr:phosphotransferase [Actinomycetota bacterium]